MRVMPPLAPPFAFAGLAWAHGGSAAQYEVQSAPGIEADAHRFWRAASISKVVVGQTARAVFADVSPQTDMSDLLGWPLRHPKFAGRPVTLAQVVSHAAGLSDAAGYAVHGPLRDWIAVQGAACFGDAPPGVRFDYCNLGYVVLAAAIEAYAGESLDVLAQRHVLDPMGVRAGFNWIGLDAQARARALPTYRRDGTRFVAQIDAGEDVTPGLSPQGGLRLSLEGALGLARGLRGCDVAALVTPDTCDVDPLGGVFEGYGWGVQVFDKPTFYPRPLVGHFANAYGFVGGVWYDPQADFAFTMALNGLPIGDESDAFRAEELALFEVAVAQA